MEYAKDCVFSLIFGKMVLLMMSLCKSPILLHYLNFWIEVFILF
jgi:hypothetical protein